MSFPRSARARRRGTLVLGCLFVVGLLSISFGVGPGAAQAPAAPAARPTVAPGLSKMILGLNAGPSLAQNLSLLDGVQYYRIGITFNNATILAINRQARTTGVDYLGVLAASTLGVQRGGSAFHEHCVQNCNWTLSDWDHAVRQALADYPTIHEWEIWNEPYSSTQRSGYLTNASTYYQMTKSAYSIIKSVDKNDTVVCLGGSGVAISSALTFAKSYWSYGASSYCNAISLHAYVSGLTLFSTSRYERTEWPKNLGQYESVTSDPIWITEFGRQSAEAHTKVRYTQQNQNEFLVQAMGIFENLSYVKRAYVFNLAGLSNPPDNTDFGLLNATTLQPKIAWHTFLSLYGSSLSHAKVPTVTERAPKLQIAHLTISRLVPDTITVHAPHAVDPIEILVNGAVKATGTGHLSFSFAGGVVASYDITAYDKFTGLSSTRVIKVL